MADPRTVRIARGLLDQTRKGSVVWIETADENEFKVVYQDYSVSIRRFLYNDEDSYKLSIYNERGTEVESLLDDDDVESPLGGIIATNDLYLILENLYELARLKSTGADEILNKLLERVGGVG